MRKHLPDVLFFIVFFVIVFTSLTNVIGVEVTNTDDNGVLMKPSPIRLVFQLLHELLNNQEIRNLEKSGMPRLDVQEEITRIVDDDEELTSLINEIKMLDCDCDNTPLRFWSFPIICTLLIPLWIIGVILLIGLPHSSFLFDIVTTIALELECYWGV